MSKINAKKNKKKNEEYYEIFIYTYINFENENLKRIRLMNFDRYIFANFYNYVNE